ncbi:hypothetical protein HYV87_02870 [Candidatus Woesearchaeota archaeon]|nr:hypothetical protein [Candidatus Woesearchaeota archaeon]
MKKIWMLLSLLSIPAVQAGPFEILGNVWGTILSQFGGLGFLGGSGLAPFTRILIGFLVFAVLFAVMSALGKGGEKPFSFFNKTQGALVAAILAIISAIFLPVNVILAVGAGWSTAVALLLIGGPVVGLGFLLWKLPNILGKEKDTKGTVVMKLIITLILFWVLGAMRIEVFGVGAGATTVAGTVQQFIDWALSLVSLMIFWYIVKFFFVAPPTDAEKDLADKEWQQKGAALREWVGKKAEAQSAKEEKGRREDLTSPARKNLVDAMKEVSEIQTQLSHLKPKAARNGIKRLKKQLKEAIRNCNRLLASADKEDRDYIGEVTNWLHAIQQNVLDELDSKIPKEITDRGEISKILEKFKDLGAKFGNVYEGLEKYHKRKK